MLVLTDTVEGNDGIVDGVTDDRKNNCDECASYSKSCECIGNDNNKCIVCKSYDSSCTKLDIVRRIILAAVWGVVILGEMGVGGCVGRDSC